MIERPSSTDLRYPWQQAICAHRALFGPGVEFRTPSLREEKRFFDAFVAALR
jgi:hypothetical protein